MRRRGVSVGLMLLLIVAAAACGSSAKAANPDAARSTTVPPSSAPPPPGRANIVGGIPVQTTVVTPQHLSSGQIAHAIEIAEGIRATGNGCATATLETAPAGYPFYKEQVSCSIGDDEITINLFANHAALVGSTSLFKRGVCLSAATQKNLNLTYDVGDNWIVFPQRTATARQLAPRLHASLSTLHC